MKSLKQGMMAGFLFLVGSQDITAESTMRQSLEVLGLKNEMQQSSFVHSLRLSGNLSE